MAYLAGRSLSTLTCMRLAWLDVSAGVAGDMLLAALLDAGADLIRVQEAVEAVLPRTVALSTTEVLRAGTRAAHLDVRVLVEDQPHRTWAEIRDRIRTADLDPLTRERALSAFGALADVEARIHGVPADEVHFHEVGAWDSIADVVGVCAAVTDLGIDEVVASPVRLGSGLVRTAHGHLAVPVPAVLALSDGWRVTGDGDGELATPTGMCLLATLASSQGPLPAMTVTASGTGGGTRDTPGRPNVVRVVIGEQAEVAGKPTLTNTNTNTDTDTDTDTDDLTIEALVVLAANVDDLDPRVWPGVIDALLAAGALDAWLTPILMKAGRPAHTVSVLARPADRETLRDLILDATSTLGVRETEVRRTSLARGWVDIELDGQRIGIKVAHRQGRVVHATPEFRDVTAAAEALGEPARSVLERAAAQAVAQQVVRGETLPNGIRTTE